MQDPARSSAESRELARALLVAALLLVQVPIGALAVAQVPEGATATAFWPNAALSVIALCLAHRRWRPWVYVGVALVAVPAHLVPGRPLDVAVALASVGLVEVALVMVGLTSFGRRGPTLLRFEDLFRLVVSTVVAASFAGIAESTVLSTWAGADWTLSWRAVATAHGAALLSMVPLALRMPTINRRRVGALERSLQWLLLGGVTVVVFSADRTAGLTFLTFPFLVWGAARLPPREVAFQLVLYGALSTWLTTTGHGPFATTVELGLEPPESAGIRLQANFLAAALVTLPLTLVRTEHLLTVDRLTRSHDLVTNILASTTGTAIVGLDNDSRIEFFNVGAERLTGYRAEDVVGRARAVLVPVEGDLPHIVFSAEEDVPPNRITGMLEPVFASGEKHVTADWPWIRHDGEKRTVQITVSRRYGDDGKPIGFLGVAEDVTERRRHEAGIAAALERERQLVDRLAQVDQTKNDFLATVSHELRTPITSILGYSELLLGDDTGSLPAMHHQVVGRIERNGRRLLGLIEDMLTMSQVEVGTVRFHRQLLDLREPVAHALEATQPAFSERGITVVHDLGDAAVRVEGDADRLERVFVNLLSNAAKFSHDGDSVVVRLGIDGGDAVFRVTDTGLGISLEDQEHLFDRFFRSSEAHARAIPGVGLGLPVAASIVSGHEGVVEVESAVGRGSTFVVRLPLATGDDSD